MASSHKPSRTAGRSEAVDFEKRSETYPDIPSDEPGLVGGPATQAVPGSDGGEGILSGRPRETGGHRPGQDEELPPGEE